MSLNRGGLREWLKLNLLLGIVFAVPALLVFPVIVGTGTLLLSEAALWSELLVQIASNLLFAFGLFVALLVALGTVAFGVGRIRQIIAERGARAGSVDWDD